MILGVIIGTYSSIFVASPILKFFKVSYKTLEKEEEKISSLINKDFEQLPLISNIGKDNKVFVLENNIAVFADLAFSSGVHSIFLKLFFDLAK